MPKRRRQTKATTEKGAEHAARKSAAKWRARIDKHRRALGVPPLSQEQVEKLVAVLANRGKKGRDSLDTIVALINVIEGEA